MLQNKQDLLLICSFWQRWQMSVMINLLIPMFDWAAMRVTSGTKREKLDRHVPVARQVIRKIKIKKKKSLYN